MGKLFTQLKKYWLSNLVTFLVSLALGAALFLTYFFLREGTLVDAIDAAAVAGMFVVLSGLLSFMGFLGVFDMVAFGFKQLGSTMFAKNPRRDGTYQDYKQVKADKRADSSYYFVPIIVAGMLYLIAFLVLEIIYKCQQ